MLNLIFQGYLEWLYSLLTDIWAYFFSALLGAMSRDFNFLQDLIPILGDVMGAVQAAGWALLLGNLVFQALKSMASGLGFEGDDPRLLFSRTFVFAFLLMASPQICQLGLSLTSKIVTLLNVPNTMEPSFFDQSVFGTLNAAWLLVIICGVIVMFKVLRFIVEIAEQYVVLAALTITAPLAFAMGGSRSTAPIFSGWCRMYGSMCLLMVTDMLFFKLLASVLVAAPVGPYVLPWMILILAIVKVARKADAIITRIGLNPAITGGGPGRSVPGMLAFTVARTAANQVVKTVGGNGGGSGKGAKASGRAKPGGTRFNGTRFAGSSQSSGGGYTYQSSRQQSSSDQSTAQQTASQQSNTAHGTTRQNNTQQKNTSHTSTQQSTGGGATVNSTGKTTQNTTRGRQTRKSSVPSGIRRSPGHVPPVGGVFHGTVQKTAPGPVGTGTGPASPQRPNGVRPGTAGTTVKGGVSAPKPSAAGSRSTHSASQTVDSRTAGSRNQTTVQTTATMGKGTSAPKAPPAAAPHPSRPNGPTVRDAPPRQGDTRSTRGKSADTASRPGRNTPPATAAPRTTEHGSAPAPQERSASFGHSPPIDTTQKGAGTSAAPAAPGASQPGPAEKPSRSTQRSAESAPRPGKNVSPANAVPPTERTHSGPAQQERTSSHSRIPTERISASTARQEHAPTPSGPAQQERTSSHSHTMTERTSSSTVRQEHSPSPARAAAKGTPPGPARQEQRMPVTPAAPPVKGGVPTVRPGGAGNPPAGKRAAGQAQTATRQTRRTNPARRPPHRKGGSGHG